MASKSAPEDRTRDRIDVAPRFTQADVIRLNNLFRGQERAAYVVALGLSGLAAYGVAALRVMPGRARSWWATLYAAGAIAGVYVFGLLWQLPGRTAVSQPLFLLIALLTVLLASAFAVLMRARGTLLEQERGKGWVRELVGGAR